MPPATVGGNSICSPARNEGDIESHQYGVLVKVVIERTMYYNAETIDKSGRSEADTMENSSERMAGRGRQLVCCLGSETWYHKLAR